MIEIPDGLDATGEPYLPDVRRLYWLARPLLDPSDPELARPCVVMAVPIDSDGVITVVQRSSTERNGEFHKQHPDVGLTKNGWFSRLRVVQAELWTPDKTKSINLLLDEETFAYVQRDFGL